MMLKSIAKIHKTALDLATVSIPIEKEGILIITKTEPACNFSLHVQNYSHENAFVYS